MMYSSRQFEISQLRQQNMVRMVESIAVFVLCLFTNGFLPQLIFKYFYANAQLMEAPPIFEYLQVGSFLLGVVYFAFAAIGNLRRGMRIGVLEKELQDVAMNEEACCNDCGDGCACGSHGSCMCGCQDEFHSGHEAHDHDHDYSMTTSADADSAVRMMKKAASKRRGGKK